MFLVYTVAQLNLDMHCSDACLNLVEPPCIYRGGNPNDHVTLKLNSYRRKQAIGMCDIFIEHKFCQFSEFVRFLKLLP